MRIFMILIIIVLGMMAYIRLSPVDVARWHVLPDSADTGDETHAGSFRAVRQINAPQEIVLEILHDTILRTYGSSLIAGSVAEGMMTVQTRSKIWGFPDYTTIAVTDDKLVIYGRLQFGQSDMGVNKARIQNLLDAVAPLTAPL